MTSPFRLALALGLVRATGSAARADIGVIVLEPVSALGFFTRVGHAGTYLSNICPDGRHAVIAGRAVRCGTREISIRTEE